MNCGKLALAAVACVFGLSLAHAQLKDWGNRFEGTEFRPNGLRDYELLGFYSYRENFPLRDDVNLRLRFFAPEESELAFVEVRELRAIKQYAMRPKDGSVVNVPNATGWREFKGWSVGVLNKNGVGADNVGVIVRLKTNQEYEQNIAPAIVLDERQPIPSTIGDYLLYLKFGKALRSLEYEVDGSSHYSQSYPYINPQSAKDPSVESGRTVELRFPAQRIPAGPVTIHISAPYANSTAPPLEIVYRFYHKPL